MSEVVNWLQVCKLIGMYGDTSLRDSRFLPAAIAEVNVARRLLEEALAQSEIEKLPSAVRARETGET